MKIMGIKFVPWNTPLKKRLQTLAVGAWITLMLYGYFIGIGLTIYLLFYTNYWFVTLLYLMWMIFLDNDICERGGRPVNLVRSSIVWKYLKDYYPFQMKKQCDFELDPKRNYLFCSFPHGIFASGACVGFGSDHGGAKTLFPHHEPHVATLGLQFRSPFNREFLLSLGTCSVSAKSINWLLQSRSGGKILVLMVGGAAEAIHCKPGNNTLVLKNRKGFVKLALQNGNPLVPVFTFGETDLFDQVDSSTLLRRVQDFVKKHTGVTPCVPIGRGLFQYNFGIIPRRRPLTMIVGKPIEVTKVEHPSQEEIDSLHKEFVEHLIKLFEENKHKYIEKPEEAKLVID